MRVLACYLFILCFLSLNTLCAQQMVVEGNRWNVADRDWFPYSTASTYFYTLKDTIDINGNTYLKLHRSIDSMVTWQQTSRYLREDSSIVYMWKDSSEIVLYDFTLEVGDTFHIPDHCSMDVIAVDSVILNNGEVRKRIRMGPFHSPSDWIEGIGSSHETINYHIYGCWIDVLFETLCFYQNDTLQYEFNHYPYNGGCYRDFSVAVEEPSARSSIKIFPNPFQNYIRVNLQGGSSLECLIFSIKGNLLMATHLNDQASQIDLNNLTPGMYIVRLTTEDGQQIHRKILKE